MKTSRPRLHAVAGQPDSDSFAGDLIRCLAQRPHTIAPKYFYDAAGSRLFEQICELPEYYLTRTELAIFRRHVGEMAAMIGSAAEIVEFGAGSLQKVRLLLDALDAPRRLTAVDISGDHLEESAALLRRDYPALDVLPLVADFTHPERLSLPRRDPADAIGRPVGFFPGSTLGNFAPDEACRFLKAAARLLAGGGLLLGVDLVKDPLLLHAAYNDAAGVTAAFNRNLLQHANRAAGSDFDPELFAHYAFYNPPLQRIEMHLISRRRQQVSVAGRRFELSAGESMHTENSYKYTLEGLAAMARACGFAPRAVWCDAAGLFSVHWLEASAALPGR